MYLNLGTTKRYWCQGHFPSRVGDEVARLKVADTRRISGANQSKETTRGSWPILYLLRDICMCTTICGAQSQSGCPQEFEDPWWILVTSARCANLPRRQQSPKRRAFLQVPSERVIRLVTLNLL